MEYKPLNQKGRNFITSYCHNKISKIIKGKNSWSLPHSNEPKSKIWTAKPQINNQTVTQNNPSLLAEGLIYWFNLYSRSNNLDANIIASQTFNESAFILWNYSETGALGIAQFIPGTFDDVFIQQRYSDITDPHKRFSDMELNKLLKNLDMGDHKGEDETNLDVLRNRFNGGNGIIYGGSDLSKKNRGILLQNMADNPDLCIKGQCIYMSHIADRCSRFAHTSLFSYNRGTAFVSDNFVDAVVKAKGHTSKGDYHKEGVRYVQRIFNDLNRNYGYNIQIT